MTRGGPTSLRPRGWSYIAVLVCLALAAILRSIRSVGGRLTESLSRMASLLFYPLTQWANRSKAIRRTGFLLFNSAREGDQHDAHAAYALAQREAYRQAQLDIEADVAAAVQSGMAR